MAHLEEFGLDEAIAVLSRTPAALDTLLRGLPEVWVRRNEGENTWNAYYIVGHLIVGERTRNDVLALRHEHPSSPVADVVTVSIGVATCRPSAGGVALDLVRAADEALYDAKRSGRDRCASRIGASPAAAASWPGRGSTRTTSTRAGSPEPSSTGRSP